MNIAQALHNLPYNARLLVSNPERLIALQKEKKSYKDAFTALLVLSLAGIFLSVIDFLLFPQPAVSSLGFMPQEIYTIFYIIGLILYPVSLIILCTVIALVEILLIKIFRGKGTFEELFYLIAVIYLPANTIWQFLVSTFFQLIDVAANNQSHASPNFLDPGYLLMNIVLVVLKNLPLFYLITLINKEVGQFSTLKAFLSWFIPALILGLFSLGVILFSTLVTNSLQSASYASNNIDGFPVIRPAANFNVVANGTDGAKITLFMLNKGDAAEVKKSDVSVAKNGTLCSVDDVRTFSFADMFSQASKTDTGSITLKKGDGSLTQATLMVISVSGNGCGGEFYDKYHYLIGMKITRGSDVLDNSGTITGYYS